MLYYLQLALSNYFNFRSRATRKEFWFLILTMLLINIAAGIIGAIIMFLVGIAMAATGFHYLIYIHTIYSQALLAFFILMLIPQLLIAFRRLHDIGLSAWWFLLPFILVALMFIGFFAKISMLYHLGMVLYVLAIVALLVAYCWPSQAHDNKYGAYVGDISIDKKPLNKKTLKNCWIAFVILFAIGLVLGFSEFGKTIKHYQAEEKAITKTTASLVSIKTSQAK
jgi:uncharacterized membrane protein YhaH (DUF805 family)